MGYKLSKMGEDVLKDVQVFCERYVRDQAKAADKKGGFAAGTTDAGNDPDAADSASATDSLSGLSGHNAELSHILEKVSEMGLGLLFVPEEEGGFDLTNEDRAAILEEIAKNDAGIGVMLMTTALTWHVLERLGTQAQREQCCGRLESGYQGAFCLTEYDAGSDISAIKVTATPAADGYILDGTKAFVTNAAVAGYFMVFARVTEDDSPAKRLKTDESFVCLLVPRDSEGVTVGAEEDKLGVKNSSTCEVNFSGVQVDKENIISVINGKTTALTSLDFARIWCGVVATGIAQASLDAATAYAKERVQFGKPIAQNEVIQAKIADMQMKIIGARAVCREALEVFDSQIRKADKENATDRNCPEFTIAASTAKCTASDAAVHCALEAVQILGGYGYCRDYPVEKLLRDAKVFQIFEGTNEIQRMIVGKAITN